MKNLKIKVISKYLRPYKKEFLYGALALLVVNILSVVIPLEVKNIIDQLQNGFSSDFIISKSIWLVLLNPYKLPKKLTKTIEKLRILKRNHFVIGQLYFLLLEVLQRLIYLLLRGLKPQI